MSRTLEQHRAKYALDRIEEVKGLPKDEDKAKYARLVRKLPAMVRNNGLGQTVAFLLADAEGKDQTPSGRLYRHLQEWLCGPSGAADRPSRVYICNGQNLIGQLMAGDRASYLRAQREALALLVWMSKFADAYLPKGGE